MKMVNTAEPRKRFWIQMEIFVEDALSYQKGKHIGHYFEPKNPYFKSRRFLQELKEGYTELINEQIGREENRLEVYRKDSIYLPTKKIGKNNPNEDFIKQNNKAVQDWNYAASFAAGIMSEDHVKEVKRKKYWNLSRKQLKQEKISLRIETL